MPSLWERINELAAVPGESTRPHHLYVRSDNGSLFMAELLRQWLGCLGVKTLCIEPSSPWENGYIESFNGKMRDELLNAEIFDTILEARVVTEPSRKTYNTIKPHSSLGYRPSAPGVRYPLSLPMAEPIN
jgi:putative transposase